MILVLHLKITLFILPKIPPFPADALFLFSNLFLNSFFHVLNGAILFSLQRRSELWARLENHTNIRLEETSEPEYRDETSCNYGDWSTDTRDIWP